MKKSFLSKVLFNERYELAIPTTEQMRRYWRLIDVKEMGNAWLMQNGRAFYVDDSVVLPEDAKSGGMERAVVPMLIIKRPAIDYAVGALYGIGRSTWKVLAADDKRVLAICTSRKGYMYHSAEEDFTKAVDTFLMLNWSDFLGHGI